MNEPEIAELRVRQALGVMRALKFVGEDLLARSVPLAPVEEGTLRGSATVAFIIDDHRFEGPGAYVAAQAYAAAQARAGTLRKADVEVSFNTVYAARQHEEKDWHHPLGGQADYLGAPMRANAGRYARAIELEQRQAFIGHGR